MIEGKYFTVTSGFGEAVDFGEMDTEGDEYLYIDVLGRGTVVIKAEDDGIVVDVYPFHVVDGPVATLCATMDMLVEEEVS